LGTIFERPKKITVNKLGQTAAGALAYVKAGVAKLASALTPVAPNELAFNYLTA